MRRVSITIAAIFYSLNFYGQKENHPVSSKIEKVTVFLNGAQVERVAKQNLKTGKYNLVFGGISPKVDKQSIQLKAEGKLVVLSVTHQLNHLQEQEVQEEIRQVELQKEQLVERIGAENNLKNVYSQEEKLVLSNQSIKGASTLKAADLKEAADFQRQRLTELYLKLQESSRSLKRMEIELQKLDKQLAALHQEKDLSTSEVVVAVDVKESAPADFRLSYLVIQSSWYPTYDIRVRDISKPVDLYMKANIHQQSGEDWKDVRLFLSTGNPRENGTRPVLSPWYLRYQYASVNRPLMIRGTGSLNVPGRVQPGLNMASGTVRDEHGMPVAGASIIVKGSAGGTTTDANGNFNISLPQGGNTLIVSFVGYESQELNLQAGFTNVFLKPNVQKLEEVVVVGYGLASDGDRAVPAQSYKKRKDETAMNTTTIYQPTTTIFEIDNPYTVPDDGKLYTVDINSFELTALYEYYSVPKLDPGAYLTAKVIDWQDLNLLPGEANLFFEGTYLGNSFLDVMNAGDTLNLSLGKDKSVVVKRTLRKEYSSKKFLGNNKTDSRQYEILIRNNKQQPVQIIVEDQFPVSTNKDIDVDKLSYDNGKLDDDTKKVTWSLLVDGKKETAVVISYAIKYPKDKVLYLD